MLKNISNLGKTLTKGEQKSVKGGFIGGMRCRTNRDCWDLSEYTGPGDVSCRQSPFSPFKVCVFY